MIVIVESNYLLELAFLQEQHTGCMELMQHAEKKHLTLVLPAYCIGECLEKLARRKAERLAIQATLGKEIRELGRAIPTTSVSEQLRQLTESLVLGVEQDRQRFDDLIDALQRTAELIPMDKEVIARSMKVRAEMDFSPQDAIVFASLLVYLERTRPPNATFVTKNVKDFENPDVRSALRTLNCELKTEFAGALAAVEKRLRENNPP